MFKQKSVFKHVPPQNVEFRCGICLNEGLACRATAFVRRKRLGPKLKDQLLPRCGIHKSDNGRGHVEIVDYEWAKRALWDEFMEASLKRVMDS